MPIHHVPAPQPRGWIILPDRAGTIRGTIEKIEQRQDGSVWVCLSVPQWVRTPENLTAGLAHMWAPMGNVRLSQTDDLTFLTELMRRVWKDIAVLDPERTLRPADTVLRS